MKFFKIKMPKFKLPEIKIPDIKIKAKQDSNLKIEESKAIWRFMNRFSLIFHALLACTLNFIMESISRHSILEGWEFVLDSPWAFLYNSFLIFISFALVYLVRRRMFTRLIISVAWLILGISNGYMLQKRVTPLNAQDLKVLGDAISLISSYFTGIELVFVCIAIVAVIIGLIVMWLKGGQYKGKMRRGLALICCIGWFASFMYVTEVAMDKRVISNYFGNIAFAYEDYGLPYCFMASIFDTGIAEPHDYSEELMMKITNDGTMSSISVNHNEVQPNIIFVQLESFFDPTEIEFFETSTDPIPNFRELVNEYSAGYFKVPSVGAGTANTEFEVLTGMNMRYFGPGEYPYKTILKQGTAESAATALAKLGYGTHALHNNGGNFYSRAIVYDNVGFDSYTCKEFMNILQWTPGGWAKDDILIKYINDAMNSTEESDFVFTISVEGHGSYFEEKVIQNPVVTVSGIEDEGLKNSWEYYIDLVYEMDKFVGGLVTSMEERDEPTVIVFYGDHLPTLGINTEDLKSRYLYNTNYVIWDNIGLEKKDQNLAAYQIMAEVFSQVGIESGTIFNYHNTRRKTTDYLSDLEILQYDMLYGNQYAYKDNEILDDEGHMKMGIKDVVLTGIKEQINGNYSLLGENFTKWSDVYVNDSKRKIKFINDQRIDIRNTELENGDIIVVTQEGSSETIFRKSGEYEYKNGELELVKVTYSSKSWRADLDD